jgi:hypothetical protein
VRRTTAGLAVGVDREPRRWGDLLLAAQEARLDPDGWCSTVMPGRLLGIHVTWTTAVQVALRYPVLWDAVNGRFQRLPSRETPTGAPAARRAEVSEMPEDAGQDLYVVGGIHRRSPAHALVTGDRHRA